MLILLEVLAWYGGFAWMKKITLWRVEQDDIERWSNFVMRVCCEEQLHDGKWWNKVVRIK